MKPEQGFENSAIIIGGIARVGKSMLTRMLLERNRIPYASADATLHMLMDAAPQLGVNDGLLYPDNGRVFYPFLRDFLLSTTYSIRPYVVEGEVIIPEVIPDLTARLARERNCDVRACFLGNTSITVEQIVQFVGPNSWFLNLSQQEQVDRATYLRQLSGKIKVDCNLNGQQYFEMAGDHQARIEEAYGYLIR